MATTSADQAYDTYIKSVNPKIKTLLNQYGKLQYEV